LRAAFGSVDLVDLWTGGLSEHHAPGALVGPTFGRIIALQFESLRDGDRLWYENQGFDGETLREIGHTTLADIIRRNTDTVNIQDDVFVFYSRHSGVAEGVETENPDARQLVIGADGMDALVGGPDDDYLFAGRGSQIMTGGAGADRFVVGAGTEAIITDFTPGEDRVEIVGEWTIRDVQFWSHDAGTLLQVGDVRIGLVGIQSWELGAADFRFGD
jgi:Ca2+-binding RTX toxin-like protein